MKMKKLFAFCSMFVMLVSLTGVFPAAAAPLSAGGTTRQIPSGGTVSFTAAALGTDVGVQEPEFSSAAEGDTADSGGDSHAFHGVNRSFSSPTTGNGRTVNPHKQAKSNPELNLSMNGLNFRQQRLANGGNQFSVEPPDQGLCVGNGFVVESVNDVIRVFHTDGTPATGVMDLNTFYGYPAAFNRTTGVIGPEVTDPSCIYDQTTGHFVHVILTLEVVPSGANGGRFIGPNHLDVAVSNTSDPTGTWTIYRIPVQDDGTAGTPDHHCSPAGSPPPAFRTNPRACIGDYPHIGADRNGIYLETNEYDFFGNAYHGSQIYAISNAQLASLPASISVTQFDTANLGPGGKPGFTIWPAQTPGNQFSDDQGGTEYFLSSNAADEAQCDSEAVCRGNGTSNQLVLWALTNTSSLSSGNPSLSLSNTTFPVDQYAIPFRSNQKAGDFPLGQCINDTTLVTPFGPGCWQILFFPPGPAHNEVEAPLDSNDTRMQQVSYANGKVWGALDTDIIVNGVHKAGIEYFIVKPDVSSGSTGGSLALQGTLALASNNLTYPAIGVTSSGRGVMAFTVVGDDHYPSAGYSSMDASIGAGNIHIAAEGVGPQDGFCGYNAFDCSGSGQNIARPRWGDYGAAAVDGKSIWIASEYIAQTCTFAQYTAGVSATSLGTFGSCGGTRTSLGNWSTRLSKVTP
jgi:hypothetical protein